jgi:uncharacterized membrane protein
MFDVPRLHAALNDLPAALLFVGVVFDILAAATKRDGFRVAGYWMIVTGAIGAGLALTTGLLAERVVEHGDAMHRVMSQHETLAIATTVLFGAIALWRVLRRGQMGPREQPVLLTAGVIGVALLFVTSQRGGKLVFDYAGGIPTESLHRALDDRGSHSHEGGAAPAPDAPAEGDSADTAASHEHAPGTPAHEH